MSVRGLIELSSSPWSSPIVLAKTKDGEWRFCVDYRRLNAITTKDIYPLPRIESTLARLHGADLFTIMDLERGYWQIPLKESDCEKTAFTTASCQDLLVRSSFSFQEVFHHSPRSSFSQSSTRIRYFCFPSLCEMYFVFFHVLWDVCPHKYIYPQKLTHVYPCNLTVTTICDLRL